MIVSQKRYRKKHWCRRCLAFGFWLPCNVIDVIHFESWMTSGDDRYILRFYLSLSWVMYDATTSYIPVVKQAIHPGQCDFCVLLLTDWHLSIHCNPLFSRTLVLSVFSCVIREPFKRRNFAGFHEPVEATSVLSFFFLVLFTSLRENEKWLSGRTFLKVKHSRRAKEGI